MSLISNHKEISTQKQRSNGGKNRANNLSPERRKEIAIKASHSRKCLKNTPKATHFDKIYFGDIEMGCAVLENGEAVVTESSIYKLFGMSSGGRKKKGGEQIPRFLSANNRHDYTPATLRGGAESFDIILPKNGGTAYAYKAEKVPLILGVYINAKLSGVQLTDTQQAFCRTAEIISLALSQVGIISLIHEKTGWQKERENDGLQKLFHGFIAKELQPYLKKFPPIFFSHMKRMYGLEHMKKNPPFFGHLINSWIYDEISPELRSELVILNPSENGKRKHCHHQFLTEDIGCPVLQKQIMKVITLMSVSDCRDDFEKLLEKSKGVKNGI